MRPGKLLMGAALVALSLSTCLACVWPEGDLDHVQVRAGAAATWMGCDCTAASSRAFLVAVLGDAGADGGLGGAADDMMLRKAGMCGCHTGADPHACPAPCAGGGPGPQGRRRLHALAPVDVDLLRVLVRPRVAGAPGLWWGCRLVHERHGLATCQ